MRQGITIGKLFESITTAAKGRFEWSEKDAEATLFEELMDDPSIERRVLRIQPRDGEVITKRTILMAVVKDILVDVSESSKGNLQNILFWVSMVKEALVDPEASDLYLFIVEQSAESRLEACLRVESSELFCRKYILHPDESIEQLIARSLLGDILELNRDFEVSDPLGAALRATSVEHPWFDEIQQAKWRSEFLSGTTWDAL